MKKYIIILIAICFYTGAGAQGIYNNGAYIVHDGGGSYWVVDGSFTLTSTSATTPTEIDNLNIVTDASLTLGSASNAAYLTVNGSLVNSGTLTLESGSTSTSSLLIGGSMTGNATVKRYFTGASLAWHLLSSPVASQEISGDFTPSGSAYDFYLYNEPTNEWINRKNTSGGGGTAPYFDVVNGDLNFTPGKGYLAAYNESNPTKSFIGTINQGTVSQSLTVDGTTQYQGANLLGNPYPSSIDWKAESGWTRTMLRDDGGGSTGYSMYIWNQTANNYGAFISNGADESGTNSVTRYVPPMQGFFVMAASAGTLAMTESVCVHESVSSWLKSGNVTTNIIKLKVSSIGYGSDEVVLEDSKTSAGGAQKWFTFVATAPSLWIEKNEKKYSILLDDVVQDDNEYTIGFKAGIEEQYSITGLFDADNYTDLILEDRKMNIYHDLLLSGSYDFYAYPNDAPDRFILHFSPVGLQEFDDHASPVQFYAGNQGLHIINNQHLTGTITLVNILSQPLKSFRLEGHTSQSYAMNVTPGVYVVYLQTDDGNRYSEKVIIRGRD